MSTPEMPKQFIDVLGVGKSLLQLTVERFEGVIPIDNVWVVTSKRYRDTVLQQLKGISEDHVLLEPCMRNTAPCIAYVSWKIRKRFKDANLVFSPADHIVMDTQRFKDVIRKGLDFTSGSDSILTLGMEPVRPETGYGYIKGAKGDIIGDGILKVEAFKEKPSIEVAESYLKDGSYYWNSGIFIWNVGTVVSSFKEHIPELADKFEKLDNVYYSNLEQQVVDAEFPSCVNISIDYAIMEKSRNVYVLPASFGWSDLGTWGSLFARLGKDASGNAIVGNSVKMIDCNDCIVHTSEEKRVVIQGLSNYIVAEKGNILLVCKMQDEQQIKEWSKA